MEEEAVACVSWLGGLGWCGCQLSSVTAGKEKGEGESSPSPMITFVCVEILSYDTSYFN